MSIFSHVLNGISKNGKNNLQANYSANTFLLKPLWFAAGADPYLLKKGTYSDQVKMACMGGTVYATALLAFISGSFAIKTIFFTSDSSSLWPYVFGLVWGAIIFNLDRFIVSSTPPNIGKVWYKKLLNALPRILMGLVISFVISKPLEIRIFEKDIDKIIAQEIDNEVKKVEDAKSKNDEFLINRQQEIIDIEKNIEEKKKDIKALEKEYDDERKGRNGVRGVGLVALSFKSQMDAKGVELSKLEEDLKNEKFELETRQDKLKNDALEAGKSVREGMKSFVNQLKIAHSISPVISWALTILFIVLELTPIFFKLMMERAPYDFQLYDRDEVIISRSTVYERDSNYFSKNAQQIEQEKQREIEAKDKSHINDVEEYKRQRQEEIHHTREQFNQTIKERIRKEAEMRQLVFENTYRAFINDNLNHEQEQLLLQNLALKEQYIQRLEELEKMDLERQLLRQVHTNKIYAQEEIEMKRVASMKLNEMNQLVLDDEYHDQLLALDKEHNAKKLKIYEELLVKRMKEESEKTALELSAKAVTKFSYPLDIQRIKQGQNGNENQGVLPKDSTIIPDALIIGKHYKPGENYAEIKILTADTIRKINEDQDLTDQQVKELLESEENKIITDAKLAQFKKGKDLLEAVKDYLDKSNGSGLQFNMDEAISIDRKARKALKEKMVV